MTERTHGNRIEACWNTISACELAHDQAAASREFENATTCTLYRGIE